MKGHRVGLCWKVFLSSIFSWTVVHENLVLKSHSCQIAVVMDNSQDPCT